MGLLKLSIDRQNRVLAEFNGTSSILPALFAINSQAVQVQVVDPAGDLTAPYAAVDMTGYGLRVIIGTDPGDGSAPAILAGTYEAGFTWDSTNLWFSGVLGINTAEMAQALGDSGSMSAVLEVNLTNGGNYETILQQSVVIEKNIDAQLSTAPSPSDTYLTTAQTIALFKTGTGSPEGVVTASPGQPYLDTNEPGGFWVKKTGTGNTGWRQLLGN